MNLKIRVAISTDEPFLREMLYQAIYVPEGEASPDRSILYHPTISRYVNGWGREGDFGLIADLNGKPVGAAWIRLFSVSDPGFGWIDVVTPELSMAIDYKFRGQGIGTKLLMKLLNHSPLSRQISLSVSPNNPVVRLYKRMGFVAIGKSGESVTMLRS